MEILLFLAVHDVSCLNEMPCWYVHDKKMLRVIQLSKRLPALINVSVNFLLSLWIGFSFVIAIFILVQREFAIRTFTIVARPLGYLSI